MRTDFNLLLFNLVVAETGIAIFGIITDFVATARYVQVEMATARYIQVEMATAR